MEATTNQPTNNAAEAAHTWRDTIRKAIEAAREYAKAVADDYTDEWHLAAEEDRRAEATRAAGALLHASDWYATADELEKALTSENDCVAADQIKTTLRKAGETTQADWCCPIVERLGKAAQEALAKATANTPGTVGSTDAAAAAASLAEAYAEAVRWG